MKITRLPVLLATGALALSAGAWLLHAQSQPPAPAAGPGIERAARFLDLSPEQTQQVIARRDAHRAKLEAIRDDASLAPDQKRAQAREVMQGLHREVAAILTPEQQAKAMQARHQTQRRLQHAMQARKHQQVARWHQRQAGFGSGPAMHADAPRPGGPGPRPLALGPGQNPGFAPGFDGPRGPQPWGDRAPGPDLQLTPEQQTRVQALQKRQQEKMQESMQAFRAEVRALLTPEQQKKFDAQPGPGPR